MQVILILFLLILGENSPRKEQFILENELWLTKREENILFFKKKDKYKGKS